MIKRNLNAAGNGNTFNGNFSQQTANSITNINLMPKARKRSVVYDVLKGILELETEAHPSRLDTEQYTIVGKIDHNNIIVYREALDLYIQESQLIEQRLRFLSNNKDPTAPQKLYNYIKRVYMRHCGTINPDERIECICSEIEEKLSSLSDISIDETAFIPVIVFYVFSKCHIFEKPPTPL